jgi:hypothetical protein
MEPQAAHLASASRQRPRDSSISNEIATLSTSTLTSLRQKKATAYDAAFEQALIDSSIYPYNRGRKPNNWAEIKD